MCRYNLYNNIPALYTKYVSKKTQTAHLSIILWKINLSASKTKELPLSANDGLNFFHDNGVYFNKCKSNISWKNISNYLDVCTELRSRIFLYTLLA